MISLNEFSARELQKLDIHELRTMARQIGVSSPTSKKKADLINSIMRIVTGKELPELKNINRGRPAKTKAVDFDFYNPTFISAFDVNLDSEFIAASPSSDGAINKKNAMLSGVVSKQKDGYYVKKFKFADTLDDSIIPGNLINIFGIKENDVLTYTKYRDALEIYTINGKNAVPQGKLEVGGKTIELAKRNILFSSSIEDKRSLLEGLKDLGKIVLIKSSNVNFISSPNIMSMPLSEINDQEIINNFSASIDVALYYKKSGINITVVAENFLSLITAVKQFDYNQSVALEKELFAKINALVKEGITFIGIIPSTLKSVFNSLSTSFDNIS